MSLNNALAGRPTLGRAAGALVVEKDFVPDARWLAASREPFGSAALRLEIGPLAFRLEGLGETQARRLETLYHPFVRPAGADGKAGGLTVLLTRAGVGHFLLPAAPNEEYRMGRRTREGGHDFWAYEFAATADPGYTRAEAAFLSEAGPLFDRGLENLLRVLAAHTVLQRGGLLVHGAGIVRDARAHIFFGPSGAGKTTVTALSPRDLVLSDDITLVLPQADGYRACGHPFGMAHHRVPETAESFPIAGLYRLVQSPDVRLDRLDRARALGDLASCLPFVMQDAQNAARALDNASALLLRTPAWRLSFRKDDAFWSAIDGKAMETRDGAR